MFAPAHMNPQGVNSRGYWDRRFGEDWEPHDGPEQSAFFTRITLARLPPWFLDAARERRWTLADWGCAQGDGTAAWAPTLAREQLTGIDFSPVAVATASGRHQGITFRAEDWLGEAVYDPHDVIYSSNTLEHFHRPMDVLAKVCRHARSAVILTVPYREAERPAEHFVSFTPANIPTALSNGMRLVWARVMDSRFVPDTRCTGEQIILLYVADSLLPLIDTLAATVIEHDDASGTRDELARVLADGDTAAQWEAEARDARTALEARSEYVTRLEARVRLLEQRHARKLSTRLYRWARRVGGAR